MRHLLRTSCVLLFLLVPGVAQADIFILVIGVDADAQKNRKKDLFAAEADRVRSAFLRRPPLRLQPGKLPVFAPRLPPGAQVKAVLGNQATRANILRGLDWLARMTPRDTAFVYVSTHGLALADGGFSLVPAGFHGRRFRETGVSGVELRKRLARLPGPSVLCLDTCHAGQALEQPNGWGKCLVIAACRGSEKAFVNGMSPALVEALRGKADYNGDGVVEVGELRRYVVSRTRRNKPQQHPVVRDNPSADRARLVALAR